MTFVIEYLDGEIVSSVDVKWRHIDRSRKIISIGIYDNDEVLHELRDYDIWFFSDEASFSSNRQKFMWESRMVGGFNKETGKGKILKAYTNGEYVEIDEDLDRWKLKFNELAFISNE